MKKTNNQKSFFETYADEYDILTNATARRKIHTQEIKTLIDTFSPTSVLDAGCATGLTTTVFAGFGIKTLGFDRSQAMLKVARKQYGDKQDKYSFRYGNFEKLPKNLSNKFDLVVCLANSISGVGSLHHLSQTIRNFYNTLKPGGHIVIQMLNYYSITDGEFLPIKATRHGNIIYQRFSERRGKRLYIYINRLDISKPELKYEMFRHEFENFNPAEMVKVLKSNKFSSIKKFSDLYLKKKFTKSSRDLVLIATK